MIFSTLIRNLVLAVSLSCVPFSSLACSAAGPNTHVGKILSVDKSAGTFTLLDAETMSAVTLTADSALLNELSNKSGSVVVTYEKDGDSLRALSLK